MAGYIEDRWLKKRKDPVTGKRERTALWGTNTKRYRVKGIPGVRDRSFAALDDAKAWQATAFTDTSRRDFIDDREGTILLGDYIDQVWLPGRRDPVGTAVPMRSKIRRHIVNAPVGRLPMNSITHEHLKHWQIELTRRGLKDTTVEVIWNHLSTVLQSAVGTRLARNPCRTAPPDVRPAGAGDSKARCWTVDEAKRIREALPARYRSIADLGVGAGLRQGEAFGFSLDDIDRQHMVIRLRRQLLWESGSRAYLKLPKGKKERIIPLSPGLLGRLDDHAKRYPGVSTVLPWEGPGNGGRATATVTLLTTTWHGNRINPSVYNSKTMKPALAEVGLIAPRSDEDGWEPSREKMHHRFRHTYASVQLAAGEDIVSLSHWMGHSSPEITLRVYAHFMPDDGRRGRTAVDAWLASD